LVGKGISVISRGEFAQAEDEALATALFSAIGEVVNLPESLQNEAMALSGCGPAYFYLFVKILTEAGIDNGLSREVALKLAVETLVGAGEMLKKTGQEPQALIDMVTSPGGTTLAALEAFEEAGLNESVFKAVEAAVKRAYELGGQNQ
jgi:pyrroline-5-carboxylate reductase